MPTRTTIFATNDNVTANDLNSLAGAWNSYTPTLGGFTAGNGTATGAYIQFGKLVMFRATFTFGTTSAAASATPTLSLPVTAAGGEVPGSILRGMFEDVGTAAYHALAWTSSTTSASIAISGTNGQGSACSTTAPFTWATGDKIFVSGTYQAA